MQGHRLIIFFLLVIFGAPNLYAASFSLNQAGNHEIGHVVEYWQESQERKPLEEISQQQNWKSHKSSDINLGFSQSPYWFKAVIDYQQPGLDQINDLDEQTDLDWYIRITYPPLDYINVYLCDSEIVTKPTQQCQTAQLGDRIPFDNRARFNPNFITPAALSPGLNYLYIEVMTEGSYQLPISLIDKKSLDDYLAINDFFRGGYLTLMLSMMLYNFSVFFMTRSKTYLYYSAFILTFALFHMTYEGSGFQLLWPNFPAINTFAMPVAFAFNQIFTVLFVVNFLNLKNNVRINNYFNVLLGLAVLTLILIPLIPYKLFIPIQNLLNITITASAFFLSLKYWHKKQSAARLFTLAWAVFITGMITANLRTLGVLPGNFFTQYGYQVGSFIEIILLSLALGARIQRLQLDRIQAKHDLIHEKQEKMIELQQLIVGVCHEMNTPIGNISLSNSYLTDLGDQLKELDLATVKPSDFHDRISDQAVAIATIKSSTLALSRLTHVFRNIKINEGDHPKGTFDLSALVMDQTTLFKTKVDIEAESNLDNGTKRSILFNIKTPDHLVLESYPTAFNLIFDQLITNSWDHYPSNQQYNLEINIHLHRSNDGLSIIFSDNGTGLPSDEIDQLFMPFFTTSRGSNKRLGLGMFQVKTIIIELLNGTIEQSISKAGGLQIFIFIPELKTEFKAEVKADFKKGAMKRLKTI